MLMSAPRDLRDLEQTSFSRSSLSVRELHGQPRVIHRAHVLAIVGAFRNEGYYESMPRAMF